MPKASATSAHESFREVPEETDPLVAAADDGGDSERPIDEDSYDEEEGEEVQAEDMGEENSKKEGSDSYGAEENDMSKRHEGSWKEPKSASPNSARPCINSANSLVQDVKGGNHSNPPSESHNKRAPETSNGDVRQHISPSRPRSSSCDIVHEIVNKKPAIICSYFARGWCIKGSSCRFLHKKEGLVYGNQVVNEDKGTTEDSNDCKGSEMVENSSVPTSVDSIGLSNMGNSRKSGFLLQRALIRTYGGEVHGFSQMNKDHNVTAYSNEQFQVDVLGNGRTSVAHDELCQKSMSERNLGNGGIIPYVESIDDRHSASGEIPSRRYFGEGMIHTEKLQGESRNDTSFSGPSSFAKNPLTSKHNFFSVGSSTGINVYRDSSDFYFSEKKPDDHHRQYQHNQFTPGDPHSSLISRVSPSIDSLNAFSQAGTRLIEGSPPLSLEHKDFHKIFDYNRGFSGSTPGQLSIAGDPLSCVKKQSHQEYNWETSVPFRPSFFCAPLINSYSGRQNDPLVDSADHQKEGIKTSVSPRGASENLLRQHVAGASTSPREFIPGYDGKKSAHSFIQASETANEYCAFTTAVAPASSTTVLEEKSRILDLTHAAEVQGVGLANNMREVDKGKDTKESKVVKLFHAALIDFVKELLKPYWKEGRLSKDAHKLIVKKAVEKVLSALQPHQVPIGTEAIDHYISSSRSKLLKLVEAYVDKHSKS